MIENEPKTKAMNFGKKYVRMYALMENELNR